MNFIAKLMESGVEFTAVGFPKANRLTVHILAAVAEHEAAMISARTKAALACSIKVLSGRRWAIETVSARSAMESAKVRTEKASKRAEDLLPVIKAIQSSGIVTLRAIAAELNTRIRTSRGGEWSAAQVQRLIRMC